MLTQFNEALAVELKELDVPVFIENLAYWIRKNAANQKHHHEGRYWSYNSHAAFAKLYPFWSRQNLRSIIKRAVNAGLLLIGNFNQKSYDNTNWYTLTDKALSYYPALHELILHTHVDSNQGLVDSNQGLVENNQAIPKHLPKVLPIKDISKTPSKSLTTTSTAKTLTLETMQSENPHNLPPDMIDDWITNRKAKRAPITKTVWNRLNRELSKCDNPIDAFELLIAAGWQGFNAEWVNKSKTEKSKGGYERNDDAVLALANRKGFKL